MGTHFAEVQVTPLERHTARRAQGVPTVSVLLGDADAAEWCWQTWQRRRGTTVIGLAHEGLEGVLREWLAQASMREPFRREVLRLAAAADGIAVEELQARVAAHSAAQRARLTEQVSRRAGLQQALVAAALDPNEAALASLGYAGFPRSLKDLCALVPALPALFHGAAARSGFDQFGATVSTLLRIAEAVPQLEIAMAAEEAQLSAWQQCAPAREVTLLEEALLRLEAIPGPARRETAVEQTGAAGVRGGPPLMSYDAGALARSRAERALFRHLEGRPRTRGLFALNATLPERFGGKFVEVDLLCEALRVAVEIDGYHHFQDAVAYRRDRGKDVLLQGLGYTVVRVLAADVDAELDYVVDTIDQVMERHRTRGGHE